MGVDVHEAISIYKCYCNLDNQGLLGSGGDTYVFVAKVFYRRTEITTEERATVKQALLWARYRYRNPSKYFSNPRAV